MGSDPLTQGHNILTFLLVSIALVIAVVFGIVFGAAYLIWRMVLSFVNMR